MRARIKPSKALKERVHYLTGDVEQVKEVNPPSGKPYKMYHLRLDRNPENITTIVLPDDCIEILEVTQ